MYGVDAPRMNEQGVVMTALVTSSSVVEEVVIREECLCCSLMEVALRESFLLSS